MYTFFIEKLFEKPPKYYIFTGFAPIVTFLALNRNIFVMIDNKYRYHYIKKKAVYFPKDLVKAYNLNKSIKKELSVPKITFFQSENG